MNYSREVENMCVVTKGPHHGPAPIPEEGRWVQAKEIKDIVEKAKEITSEGKDIADEMINGYVKLNQDITSTISLINDVQNSSKEQLQGIEQINNSISSLDKQTQQNATVANKTQEIAINTDKIAKLIVEDANNKEFIGKENIKSGA